MKEKYVGICLTEIQIGYVEDYFALSSSQGAVKNSTISMVFYLLDVVRTKQE